MVIKKSRVPILDILLIGILPGFAKKWLYQLKGYRIGKNVKIGFGSVVIGKDIQINEGVEIGFLTILRSEKLRIGSFAKIGSMTFIDTPIVSLGEDSKINEQVFIGGLQLPNSQFALGARSQILQLSYINPYRLITIGSDSAVGGHSLIFGHSSWQNVFEGYAAYFDDIEIGNNVSISWRVFVAPGAKIGDGAIIGTNSLVNGVIPPKSLATGSPARVVSREPYLCRELTIEEKRSIFNKIVEDMKGYFRDTGWELDVKNWRIFLKETDKRQSGAAWKYSLAVCQSASDMEAVIKDKDFDVLVSLEDISESAREGLEKAGIHWLEIISRKRSALPDALTDEVAMWFRRYGVKFERQSPVEQ